MARILAVDDDNDILNLVRARLRQAGHNVATASSVAEALETLADRGVPDLLVLDVALADGTGLDLLDRVRELYGDVPAVFLSARVTPEDIEAGRAKGAVYLTKPFVATALVNAVERSLPIEEEEW